MNYQDRIGRLTEKLAALRAHQLLKEQAARNRQARKDRKTRDRQIYKAGGIVDKMGLLSLAVNDEVLLLGVFAQVHWMLEGADQAKLEAHKIRGREFLPVGTRKAEIRLGSRAQSTDLRA